NARMPDKGDPPRPVVDLRGRPVGVGAGQPLGPVGPRSGQPPADQIDETARLRAVGIKETRAVEVVRYRAVVVARQRAPAQDAEQSGRGKGAQRSDDPAARGAHPQSRSSWTLWR